MTTGLAPSPVADRPVKPLRFPTLLSVELRKMTDTRSSRALLAGTVATSAAVLSWKLAHAAVPTSFHNYSGGVATMIAFLAPLIGLLAMTSEWTQRTSLTTFTLAPRRLPVLAAKYVASLLLALASLSIGLVLAALACAVGGRLHGPVALGGWPGDVRSAAVFVLLQLTMGAAFGALAANTAVALTAFLLAPTLWAIVAANVLRSAASWFDIFETYGRLASVHPLEHVARTLTSIGVWVLVPATIGLARSLRREVK